MLNGKEAELRSLMRTAEDMCVAARTAPKAKGIDYIETAVLWGDELERLASKMTEMGEKSGMKFLIRDAGNVRDSVAVVLIGVSYHQRGLTEFCSLCNFAGCEKLKEAGGVCVFDPMDLGIAIGSAVSVAADHRVDNRILFSAGKAAYELGYLPEDVKCIMAIPLYSGGKSIFFDRKRPGSTV